jgi:hypothetical protein
MNDVLQLYINRVSTYISNAWVQNQRLMGAGMFTPLLSVVVWIMSRCWLSPLTSILFFWTLILNDMVADRRFRWHFISHQKMSSKQKLIVGGNRKSGLDPRTQGRRWANVPVKAVSDIREDKEPSKDCLYLKSCESPCTCPHAPFYRETNGLLHSDNTIELKDYS